MKLCIQLICSCMLYAFSLTQANLMGDPSRLIPSSTANRTEAADSQPTSSIAPQSDQGAFAKQAAESLLKLGWDEGQQAVPLGDSIVNINDLGPEYLIYIPEGYGRPDEKWPLLLFLHGSGERGTDIQKVATLGPPKLAAAADYPFIVVSPQCKPGRWWNTDELIQLVQHLQSILVVDQDRIYVTGLSMGGYATWSLITSYPDTFAAAIPICGGADPANAERVKELPIWAFHGDKDQAVPLARIQDMVDRLEQLKHPDFTFTVYPGVGHDSWTRTYANPEVFEWMLSKRR